MDSRSTQPQQPFSRGQGSPLRTGPFLGGYLFTLLANVAAGGTVSVAHTLRVVVRHVEVVGNPNLGEFPSRVAILANGPSMIMVKFESAQSAGAVLFLW